MNEKALRTLEYTKIIDLLTEKATSEPGRALCRNLEPFDNLSDIAIAQQETADALTMLFAKGSTSFGGNRDISYSLRSLEIGSSLSASELLKIAGLLKTRKAFHYPYRRQNPLSAKFHGKRFLPELSPGRRYHHEGQQVLYPR